MKKYITNNVEETNNIAKELIKELSGVSVLALSGNLGVGKTVFVKAIAKELGIEENVTSPTFVLMKVYDTKDEYIKKMVHVDCYRLDGKEDLHDIGLGDYVEDKNTLVIIEWSDKISNLPENSIKVNIKTIEEDKRNIIIE